jgi:tetratricopeptide (TPR) repeat protein
VVGHHVEQAYRYRDELGSRDARTEELARRAAGLLARAGHGALGRGDVSGAVQMLERAVELDRHEHVEPLIELAEALQGAGQLERAVTVLAEAADVAERDGDRRALASIMLDRLDIRSLVEPDFGLDEMQAGAEEALVIFEELGDELGLARAWRSVAEVHLTRCHWRASEEALEQALEHAERGGGAAELAAGRIMLANALFYGPTPVAEARARCEELRALEPKHPVVEGNILCYLGGLAALEGNYDEARELHGRGRSLFEELGHTVGIAGSTTVSGPIELLAGEPAAAECELRAGYEAFEAMGETGILSTLAAMLGEAVLAQGREDEADELTRTSEQAAADDDAASQIAWRAVRSRAIARRGDVAPARTLADEAVARAEATDFLVLHAQALDARAEVLRAAGEGAAATRDAEAREELLAAKGARLPAST